MDIASLIKTLLESEWSLETVPTFCTSDMGHDSDFELFNANTTTPQVAINTETQTEYTPITDKIFRVEHNVNLLVYVKPIRYDETTIQTAKDLFNSFMAEIDRILRENRFVTIPFADMKPSGWKWNTAKREEPIIFAAAQTVKVVYYIPFACGIWATQEECEAAGCQWICEQCEEQYQ